LLIDEVLRKLILRTSLSFRNDSRCDQIFSQGVHLHQNNVEEVLRLEHGSKQGSVLDILVGEAVHKNPVDQPCVHLNELEFGDLFIVVSLVDKVFHLLESCVFNYISSFTVKNLTGKESPENLKHQIRVVILLIDKNFFKSEQ